MMNHLTLLLIRRIIPVLFLSVFFNSCYYDNLAELHPNISEENCDTAVAISYANDIIPILSGSCGINNSCHDGTSFFPMDTYTGVTDQAASGILVKSIKHDPSLTQAEWMPSGGGMLDKCSILKIETWVNRGSPNN